MTSLELVVYPLRDKVGRDARPGYVVGKRAVSTADAYRRGIAKRLTDAELAAEMWMQYWGHMSFIKNGKANIRGKVDRQRILHRFATLPHYDEDQP